MQYLARGDLEAFNSGGAFAVALHSFSQTVRRECFVLYRFDITDSQICLRKQGRGKIMFAVARTLFALLVLCVFECTLSLSPPLPWAQHGDAYVQVFDVPLSLAKECIPENFDVVETKPESGVTQGSLYIAKYDNRSAVEYNELIFICATVEYEGHRGNWVSSIFVDNKIAQEAGINVWGLPKKLATFEWDRATSPNIQHVVVKDASTGSLVIDAAFDDKAVKIPFMHQTIQTFGRKSAENVLVSETEQKYGVKMLGDVILNVPSSSPLFSVIDGSQRKAKVEMVDGLFNMTAPSAIEYIARSRARGYFRTTSSVPLSELKVEGKIPEFVRGALLRNSPGQYENGDDQVRHWNDGWAQLHRWYIDGSANTVTHQSRMLNSSSYHRATIHSQIQQVGYGTPANPGQRPHEEPGSKKDSTNAAASDLTGFADKFTVNPMVNLWKFDNKYMTTTDQNIFIEFDPVSLLTKGGVNDAWDPKDPITKKGAMGIGVAHGRYDRYTKEHFWLEIDLGDGISKSKYNLWTYQETGFNGTGTLPARKLIGTIEDAETSFIHSFGLTKKYILLIQCPMHYHFLKFVTAKEVIDTITWDNGTATKFHILDRETGKLLKTVDSPEGAWFVYHVLNAFEDEQGNIVVDFSRYHNDTLITYGMYLENLIDRPKEYVPTFEQARLTRCTIPIATSSDPPSCLPVVDKTFEMATFNFVDYHMKKPRYSWGASFVDPNVPWNDGTSDFIDQLIKVDIEEGTVAAEWHEEGKYVCEPVFVPRPDQKSEDDGALIFVSYDSLIDASILIILDGVTMKELARATMVGRLAANFHGKFCPDDEYYCIGL